ncbi:hypothetical protein DNTS_007661, partial [Danionella cerebrum]
MVKLSKRVSNVQSHSAVVSWSSGRATACSYELQLKDKARDGKYKLIYSGEELQFTLTDLRPATDYHVRVCTVCDSVKGPSSEVRAFTTHSAPPDTPLPPRLSHRSKSSLTLQWKPPPDNGSKIMNYILEWDEGKKNSVFREYYVGSQRHCKVMRLCPAVGYTFRVAALNDMGTSGFSTEVVFHTTGSVPQGSLPPRLLEAGPTWLKLEWTRPNSCSAEEVLTYTLEMQDESKGLDFQAVYSGLELNHTVEALRRNSLYKFRLIICSGDWRSAPSSTLVCKTSLEQPGAPLSPEVVTVTQHSCSLTWEIPEDDGGSEDLTYILQMSEDSCKGSSSRQWVTVYTGAERKHTCEDLKAASSFSLRLGSVNDAGQGQWSDELIVCTRIPSPGRCHPPSIVGTVKHKELSLQWGAALEERERLTFLTFSVPPDSPLCAEENEALQFSLEMCAVDDGTEPTEVYGGSRTECTVGNLLPGTTYRFHVRAANSSGFGPYSDWVEISTAAGPPEQCSPPNVTVTSHTCAHVTWQSNNLLIPQNLASSGMGVSEYRLDWGADLESMELVYSGTETQFQICSLNASTEYCCRLQAVNQAGAGPYSDLVRCRTPAAPPDSICVVQQLDHPLTLEEGDVYTPSTCVALTWDAPCCNGAEITSYSIHLEERIICTGNTTFLIIRDLLPDSEY